MGSGYGFKADTENAKILNGVVNDLRIIDPGSGYDPDKNFTLSKVSGTGGNGTGLQAMVKGRTYWMGLQWSS